MKQQKYIILFILVTSVSFIPFIGFTGIYSIIGWNHDDIALHLLINLPVCAIIGCSDYFLINWLAKVCIQNKPMRLVMDLTVTTITCVAIICILNFILSDFSFSTTELMKSALPAIPWNWVVSLLIELFFYNNRQQEIEREKANYQYIALRNQINPHFLFNSLNTLASLAYIDGEKANLFTKRLSSVYRYLLSNNGNRTVEIDHELEFVNKYLYLEQVRFENAIDVEIQDRRQSKLGRVVPASIQMLVENAIKHNSCSKESPLSIRIIVDNDNVTVLNNLQPRKNIAPSGVGLENIRRQYELLDKRITVIKTDKEFIVTLPTIHHRQKGTGYSEKARLDTD